MTKRPATEAEKQMLDDLSHCTFAVGSFDKRFVRDVGGAVKAGQELTDKQAALIPTLHYRYRRQHGKPTPDYDPATDPKAHRKPIKTTPIDVVNHWAKDTPSAIDALYDITAREYGEDDDEWLMLYGEDKRGA